MRLLLFDDAELPAQPDEAEAAVAERLGEAGLKVIDEALKNHARSGWLKVARVVGDALKANSTSFDEGYVALYARRVVALVEAGVLEAQGNLRRPRFSEVRLPGGRAS